MIKQRYFELIGKFQAYCENDGDYKISYDPELLKNFGISVAKGNAVFKRADFYEIGADAPVPISDGLWQKLSQCRTVHDVNMNYKFDREAPNFDTLQGAAYSAVAIAHQLSGLVVEPSSGIVYEPLQLQDLFGKEQWDPYDHICIRSKDLGKNRSQIWTQGFKKFGQSEFVINDFATDLISPISGFIYHNLGKQVLFGRLIGDGETMQSMNPPFQISFCLNKNDQLTISDTDDNGGPAKNLSELENVVRQVTKSA